MTNMTCRSCNDVTDNSPFLLHPHLKALQRQRAMLDRMLLAIPHHIEVVDCYAHKGEVEEDHYALPWILGG